MAVLILLLGATLTSRAQIEEMDVPLEKTDIRVVDVKLVWIPVA